MRALELIMPMSNKSHSLKAPLHCKTAMMFNVTKGDVKTWSMGWDASMHCAISFALSRQPAPPGRDWRYALQSASLLNWGTGGNAGRTCSNSTWPSLAAHLGRLYHGCPWLIWAQQLGVQIVVFLNSSTWVFSQSCSRVLSQCKRTSEEEACPLSKSIPELA